MKIIDQYKHFSFDLDGTLVHTVAEYRNFIVPLVVSELKGTIKDHKSIDRFWFEANRDEIIEREFGLDAQTYWDLFRKRDKAENRGRHTFAYEDAERTLRRLKALGKIVTIITGAPEWVAQMEIEKLNGAPYDCYLSIYSSNFAFKPSPDSMYYVLDKLDLKASETVYIGNSNEDAYFAKNAGVDFLYLERKEHQFDWKDYAVTTIHSLDELI